MALPEKPNLPDRLFYSIPKAVKKINSLLPEKDHIDESDLLHFFIIGKLEICFHVKVNGADLDDDGDPKEAKPTLEFTPGNNVDISKVIEFLKKLSDSNGKAWIKTDYGDFSIDYSTDDYDLDRGKYFFDAIAPHQIDSADFLLSLHRVKMMTSTDKIIENGLYISGAKIPRTTNLTIFESSDLLSINMSAWISFPEQIYVKYSDLIITHQELELFLNGGKDIPIDKEFNYQNKNIRIQNPERILNQIFLKEHFSELFNESKSSQLADELNYLSEKHGFSGDEFNKQTMSGWIKKYKN